MSELLKNKVDPFPVRSGRIEVPPAVALGIDSALPEPHTDSAIRKISLDEAIALHEKGELVGAFDMTNTDYHNAPGISKSGLDDVAIAPAIFKYNRENPPEPTDDLEFGNACHTAVLEPERFAERYVVAPVELNRRGTKNWDAFEAKHASKTVLKYDAGLKCKQMSQQFGGHSRARNLRAGYTELSFFWKDPQTGLLCKCRVDMLPGKGVVADYKSARCVGDKRKWARDLHEYRYHVQAAFYLDGIWYALRQSEQKLSLIKEAPDTFVFVAQEKTPPYLIKPWIIGAASVELGRRIYQKNLQTVAECERTGVWPGYLEQMEIVECPDYAWNEEVADE